MFANTGEIRWLSVNERINAACEWEYWGSEAQDLPMLGEHRQEGNAHGADWET